MPSDRPVMPNKRPVFSCESEKPGKSQGEKKLLENKRWWNLQAAGRHTEWESGLRRISENTELCWPRGP